MIDNVSLGILIIALGVRCASDLFGFLSDPKIWKRIFIVSVAVLFGFSLFFSVAQYLAWKNAPPPASFLVPPYAAWGEVVKYSFTHFWLSHLVSFAAGIFFMIAAGLLNRKFKGRFFYQEEIYMMGLGIFASGEPAWMIYLLIIFCIAIPLAAFFSIFFKKRLSLYYFWIPAAILAIIIEMIFRF